MSTHTKYGETVLKSLREHGFGHVLTTRTTGNFNYFLFAGALGNCVAVVMPPGKDGLRRVFEHMNRLGLDAPFVEGASYKLGDSKISFPSGGTVYFFSVDRLDEARGMSLDAIFVL